MSRRVIHTEREGERVAVRVVRDAEWNEYRAELWIDGAAVPDATYHTDDRRDAIATARVMAAEAVYRLPA